MTTGKQFREIIDRKSLTELPYYLSRLEYRIYNKKKLGISSNTGKIKDLMNRRCYVRKKLLLLLKEWENNGYVSEPFDFSQTLDMDKAKQDKEDLLILDD